MSGIVVIANGAPRETTAGSTVSDFLRALALAPAQVLVEFNGEPLERERFAAVTLCDGDRLEIAQMVGGG